MLLCFFHNFASVLFIEIIKRLHGKQMWDIIYNVNTTAVWLLDTNFRLLWPCIMNVGRRERKTNKMQLIWCLLSNFYLKMFRASLCPSSGEQECALPHMVFCTGSDGCGCVEMGRKLCALWRSLFVPAPHNHRHHNQCRTSFAAVHTLVLLMMGIMMPKTCWDKSLIINIRLVAHGWSLSLSLFTLRSWCTVTRA